MESKNKMESPLSFPEKGIESFTLRLKELIGDGSLRSFANAIQASEGGVRKWFTNDTKPSFDKIVRISRLYGVKLEWLATGEGEKFSVAKNKDAINEDLTSFITVTGDDFTEDFALIPGYHIAVSAGHGELPRNEPIRRRLAFRRKWLSYRGLNSENLAVVFTKGDSMEPTIHNGNSLLVDLSNKKLTEGAIFVLRFGDDLYAKRLQKHFNGGVKLISDNKEYDELVVSPQEIEQLQIVGKVVWVGKDLY